MNVELIDVNWITSPRISLRKGEWSPFFQRACWTIDYWPAGEMYCQHYDENGLTPPYLRRESSWHVYAPGTMYRERFEKPENVKEILWFKFKWSDLLAPIALRKFTALFDPDDRLAPRVRALYEHQQRGDPSRRMLMQGILMTVLGECMASAGRGHSGDYDDPWVIEDMESSQPQTLLERVDKYVLRHLASPPPLAGLAKSLGMSVSSLCHRFKAETGMTINERIRWLRVRHSRSLLARGMNAKQVAHKLGFSSPSYFSKVFAAVNKVTPAEFQRQSHR